MENGLCLRKTLMCCLQVLSWMISPVDAEEEHPLIEICFLKKFLPDYLSNLRSSLKSICAFFQVVHTDGWGPQCHLKKINCWSIKCIWTMSKSEVYSLVNFCKMNTPEDSIARSRKNSISTLKAPLMSSPSHLFRASGTLPTFI